MEYFNRFSYKKYYLNINNIVLKKLIIYHKLVHII